MFERIARMSYVIHVVETYISVCGEGHTDLHVRVWPQGARGRGKASRAKMSLRALELHDSQREKKQKQTKDRSRSKAGNCCYAE